MPAKFIALCDYNSECWRGIVHTPEMDQRMADLEAEFKAWQTAAFQAEGRRLLGEDFTGVIEIRV